MVDEARGVFEQLLPDRFAAVPRDAIWPACLTFLAEAGLVVGDAAALRVLYEELLPWTGQTLLVGFTTCFGPADRLLGALAARLGQFADAEQHFSVAMEVARRCHSPVWIAEVERDRAAVGRAAPAVATFPDELSEREVEVLQHVATGLSNREIGARLFISQNTVANHVRAILRKTGCANRTEAAGYAMRHNLLRW
jgi:DNA-binding CsgD family transcriptional regulator